MRTAAPAALARGERNDPEALTPEVLDLAGRAQRLARQVTARPEVRQRLRGIGLQQRLHTLLRASGARGLQRAAEEMLDLYHAGATRAELALYGLFLGELEADLFVGAAREPRAQLEHEEAAHDTHEDLLQVRGLLAAQEGRETPELLRERAAALRAQSGASTALAGRLEFDARQAERRVALA